VTMTRGMQRRRLRAAQRWNAWLDGHYRMPSAAKAFKSSRNEPMHTYGSGLGLPCVQFSGVSSDEALAGLRPAVAPARAPAG